jgi:hypothetical protein
MPPASDVDVYRRMVRRIAWLVVAIGLAGAATAAVLRGIAFGAAFLLGAALSGASLWRWKKISDAIGGTSGRRSPLGWILQLFLVIAAAFVIIVYLRVTAVAVVLGLLVSTAAIIVAILLELVWNTNSG